ncbi:bifunctional 2-polyprenyl-6-hydroxyphenol methylase/3-demethylubiquinol 3-O-methyltransferase UbiG [Geobacter sp. DSM 9736]|uniref:class I SAM-dependent methyltransferase n=1 Tax=Geobacter sp. DSM 9736 TaxID=1277350 RepID=UPI000B4FE122|nr:class I SAM-dependent methyltransferase [Geobacter sp. DSM 9736]SNB48123.1 Methyltransferase domain-containing protein [Geobacter sp. DSM 9736]
MDISQFTLHAEIEDSHWWFCARREIIFSELKRFLPPGAGMCLAEIGCGTGGNLRVLERHYSVLGVDLAPEAVKYASERLEAPVFLGDFRDRLKGRWDQIDAVLLADVLEHVEDDVAFLHDIVSCLKPGGILLLTVPAHRFLWSHHDLVLGHIRRYSAAGLRALWQGLPVEELRFSSFNFILFPIMAAVRLLGRGGERKEGESDLRPLPAPLNGLLFRLFALERLLLKVCPLPYGASYLALLRKR